MKKNKKIFFEHGAHFKYLDLYTRLIQLIPYLNSDRIGNNGNYFIEQNSNESNYSNFNINKIKSELTEKINNKSYSKHKNFSYDFNTIKNPNVNNINNNKLLNYKYYYGVKENNKLKIKINLKKNLPKINFSPVSFHTINKIKYFSPDNKNNNNFSITTQYSSLKKTNINNDNENYNLIFKRNNKNIDEYKAKFFRGNLSDKKMYFQNFFYDDKKYKERMERNKMKKSRNLLIDNWFDKNKFIKTLNLNNKKYFFKQKEKI